MQCFPSEPRNAITQCNQEQFYVNRKGTQWYVGPAVNPTDCSGCQDTNFDTQNCLVTGLLGREGNWLKGSVEKG